MYADSSEEMHDWIDLMIEHGAQMYDPKLHGWRPVQVEFPDTQEASPIDITRSRSEDRDIRRSNSSANLDPKKKRTSTLKSLFQKLTGIYFFFFFFIFLLFFYYYFLIIF